MSRYKIDLQPIFCRTLPFVVFPILILAMLGCSGLNRSVPSGNGSSSGTNTSGGNGSGTSAVVSGLCENPYYPVGPNLSKTYRVSSARPAASDREYTERFSNITGDAFTVDTDFGAVKAHINWKCTKDGLLATQYNNSLEMTKSGASASIETLESSGTTLPPEDRWRPGEKWHAEYTVAENLKGPGGKEMGRGDGTVKQDGEIVGPDQVTVAAGTFDAIKTQMKTEIEIRLNVRGVSVPMKVPMQTTAWFAKGTGMVRSETTTESIGTATSELVSINR
ncbi:MAG: hypothetical protein IT173_04855 [Acidobacteria bacterium]|nr:hypothetical protein [Acidobacteriota bacterium]